MSHEPALPIFVYGTLKRGECRERCWPHPPLCVTPARVRAKLYDLGPFPAIDDGDDWVLGELWEIAEADLPHTLAVLDEVEDLSGGEYERRVIRCFLQNALPENAPPNNSLLKNNAPFENGSPLKDNAPLEDNTPLERDAYAYFYARREALAGYPIIAPNADGLCIWPASPLRSPGA